MGHYTTFKLQEVYPSSYRHEVAEAFNNLQYDCNIEQGFNAKWYRFDKAAIEISSVFKLAAFVVMGIKDDNTIWYKEYYNGRQTNYWVQTQVAVTDSTKNKLHL